VSSRIALVALSIVTSLLVLELAVRIVAAFDRNYLDEVVARQAPTPGRELTLADLVRPNADDLIVYGLRPGAQGRFLGQPVAINSLGMRDGERTLERRPGTFRIVGLGDSHMFGWGVRGDETFPALLEKSLAQHFAGRSFEVWNLAVPGYNSVQEVETFATKARAIGPDLVIVNWVGNDMDLPSFLAKRPEVYSLRRSFLLELIRRRARAWRGKRVKSSLVPVEFDEHTRRSNPKVEKVPERYRPLLGTENMMRALDRLAELAREYRIRPVVLFDWNSPQADPAKAESHDPSRMAVKRRCAAQGYLVVDTEDRVLRYLKDHHLDASALRISDSDPHPSVLRHRLIAEELFESLVGSGLIERPAPASSPRAGG
jgi:GDSL-like lipase/acylhydrolase family protein